MSYSPSGLEKSKKEVIQLNVCMLESFDHSGWVWRSAVVVVKVAYARVERSTTFNVDALFNDSGCLHRSLWAYTYY